MVHDSLSCSSFLALRVYMGNDRDVTAGNLMRILDVEEGLLKDPYKLRQVMLAALELLGDSRELMASEVSMATENHRLEMAQRLWLGFRGTIRKRYETEERRSVERLCELELCCPTITITLSLGEETEVQPSRMLTISWRAEDAGSPTIEALFDQLGLDRDRLATME